MCGTVVNFCFASIKFYFVSKNLFFTFQFCIVTGILETIKDDSNLISVCYSCVLLRHRFRP